MAVIIRILVFSICVVVHINIFSDLKVKADDHYSRKARVNVSYLINSSAVSFDCGTSKHGSDVKRMSLHSDMQPFFNFTTVVTTNLKILVLGDSTGNQIFDMLVNSLRLNVNNVISHPKSI